MELAQSVQLRNTGGRSGEPYCTRNQLPGSMLQIHGRDARTAAPIPRAIAATSSGALMNGGIV